MARVKTKSAEPSAGQIYYWVKMLFFLAMIVASAGATYLIAHRIFVKDTKDTTQISNYALAVMVAFASLSFGYSRCVSDTKQWLAIKAGEFFFESAVAFLIATLFKFFLLNTPVAEVPADSRLRHWIWQSSIIAFGFASIISHVGLITFFLGVQWWDKKQETAQPQPSRLSTSD